MSHGGNGGSLNPLEIMGMVGMVASFSCNAVTHCSASGRNGGDNNINQVSGRPCGNGGKGGESLSGAVVLMEEMVETAIQGDYGRNRDVIDLVGTSYQPTLYSAVFATTNILEKNYINF